MMVVMTMSVGLYIAPNSHENAMLVAHTGALILQSPDRPRNKSGKRVTLTGEGGGGCVGVGGCRGQEVETLVCF